MTPRRGTSDERFNSPRLIIGVGAGGHARCVLDAIRSTVGRFRVVGLYDDDEALHGDTVLGVPVLGRLENDPRLSSSRMPAAFVGIGGVGDNRPRRQLYEVLRAAGLDLPSIAHRAAIVSSSAEVGEAAQILAGAIVNAEARVGANSLVNAGAIVGHGTVLGSHVHVASGAVLGGEVTVGEGAHIGSGATVLEGRSVGTGALVGSGAVVTRDVPPAATVVGVPARAVGEPRARRHARRKPGWDRPGRRPEDTASPVRAVS